jgi:error-prone DNA polymerase
MLRQISGKDEAFTLPAGRGDQARHAAVRTHAKCSRLRKARDIYFPDLHIDKLNINARDFR